VQVEKPLQKTALALQEVADKTTGASTRQVRDAVICADSIELYPRLLCYQVIRARVVRESERATDQGAFVIPARY